MNRFVLTRFLALITLGSTTMCVSAHGAPRGAPEDALALGGQLTPCEAPEPPIALTRGGPRRQLEDPPPAPSPPQADPGD